MTLAEAPSKVTPHLIERAADLCPRRLRLAFQGQSGDSGAFLRGRVRDALVGDARDAHREMGPPRADAFSVRTDLLPEEQALQRMGIDRYLELFGEAPVQAIDHDPYTSPVERRGVLVGGWIDVVCERADGAPELRQFELWGRDLDPDPLSNTTLLLAALRLSRWVGERTLHIRHADLVTGDLAKAAVEMVTLRPKLVTLYEQRLARIRLRVQQPDAVPGESCTACPYVPGCPAFR